MKRLGQLLFLTLFIAVPPPKLLRRRRRGCWTMCLPPTTAPACPWSLRENILEIQVFNFDPYGTDLTESQRQGLEVLSAVLFDKMESLNLGSAAVEGHAIPPVSIRRRTPSSEFPRLVLKRWPKFSAKRVSPSVMFKGWRVTSYWAMPTRRRAEASTAGWKSKWRFHHEVFLFTLFSSPFHWLRLD